MSAWALSAGEHFDVVRAMNGAWRYDGRTAAARASLERFKEANPELPLAGANDLYDLVITLASRKHGSQLTAEEKPPILNAMLVSAEDPRIAHALVQTLIPGLIGACRTLHWGEELGLADEMLAVAIAKCTEVVSEWAGEERQYAGPDVLNATRHRVRRWMFQEKEAQAVTYVHDWQGADLVAEAPASPLLARLKSYEGTKHERLAGLVLRRVFDRVPLRDLARDEGLSYRQLQSELETFAVHHLL